MMTMILKVAPYYNGVATIAEIFEIPIPHIPDKVTKWLDLASVECLFRGPINWNRLEAAPLSFVSCCEVIMSYRGHIMGPFCLC